MPNHAEITIAFALPPYWGNIPRWIKGDMIYAAGFHRVDLLMMGKDRSGTRIYQKEAISTEDLRRVQACILHGLSIGGLTKHL